MENQGFESLNFYRDSLKLLKAAYRMANSLPDYERDNLGDRLRKASCNISPLTNPQLLTSVKKN
ncbi:MAG: hypothetical protein MUD14_30060 [Hydrococcus sp. Prado102]|jgi:hypothetical protein|nr:hypothetical protein [Hydrococcus sp. Prado102]